MYEENSYRNLKILFGTQKFNEIYWHFTLHYVFLYRKKNNADKQEKLTKHLYEVSTSNNNIAFKTKKHNDVGG